MIFIVVSGRSVQTRPTSGCRWSIRSSRPRGPSRANPFFDWSRSVDDPNEFVLVEAFRDGDAGAAHVQ
jgi:hypothetical protein